MEKKTVISVNHITKDYGNSRGNFDLNFQIKEGEAFGIVGENGAGKTTLIRQIMGFIKPDQGSVQIYGFDAYKDAAETKMYIGYIPGEINFPDVKTGDKFLKDFGKKMGMEKEDFAYADEIIKRMQLDIRAYPRRMSKGMKQKTSIVACMMTKTPILIMDEPSIGLDPLMREELLKLINEQRERKATILMTSNTIEELERTCDHVAYMTQGKIVDVANLSQIRNRVQRDYKIEFVEEREYVDFLRGRKDILRVKPEICQVTLRIDKDEIPLLFETLSDLNIKYVSEVKYNLTKYFEERRNDTARKGENSNAD